MHLAICNPNKALQWPFLLCTQCAVSTEESVIRAYTQPRALASSRPGVSMPYGLGYEKQWRLALALVDELKCLSIYPDHTKVYSWLYIPQLPIAPFKGLISLERSRLVQPSVYRVNGQGSWVITSRNTLSLAIDVLWFIPSWEVPLGEALYTQLGAVALWGIWVLLPSRQKS